jgi:hypothetical protein
LEYWSNDVLAKCKVTVLGAWFTNTPVLQHSITPVFARLMVRMEI